MVCDECNGTGLVEEDFICGTCYGEGHLNFVDNLFRKPLDGTESIIIENLNLRPGKYKINCSVTLRNVKIENSTLIFNKMGCLIIRGNCYICNCTIIGDQHDIIIH